MNRIINRISCIINIIRAKLLYNWRFKHCGNGVTFGHLNRIIGYNNIEIGSKTSFGNNLRLEAINKYGGGKFSPSIKIGSGVAINQNFHCTCAELIEIGNGTSITANCGIFDIIHPYEDISINPRSANIKTKSVRIGQDCLIGMNTVVLPGTVIGNHCVVGANSTVKGTFPDCCVIAGSPARIIKKYDFEKKEWKKITT